MREISLVLVTAGHIDHGKTALINALPDFPNIKIIMLSMYNSRELIVESLRAGAQGYVLKAKKTSKLNLLSMTAAIYLMKRSGREKLML